MSKQSYVYVIYISTTPEKLWNALLDGELTKLYWGRRRNVSEWKVGSKWQHQDYDDPSDVGVEGEVLVFDPPKRLALTWSRPGEMANADQTSKVTLDIDEAFGDVRLTVTHEDLDDKMFQGVSQGWPAVLSSLKTLLETGKPLPMTTKKWK